MGSSSITWRLLIGSIDGIRAEVICGNGIVLDYHVARHLCDIEAILTYEGTDTVQARAELIAILFAQMKPLLTQNQVIYLEGVIEGSGVERAIAADMIAMVMRVHDMRAPGPRRRDRRRPPCRLPAATRCSCRRMPGSG